MKLRPDDLYEEAKAQEVGFKDYYEHVIKYCIENGLMESTQEMGKRIELLQH